VRTDAGFDVEAIVAASESRIDYGFDEDWTFTGFDPDGYTSTDRYLRDRSSRTLELRLSSDETAGATQWLVGVFDLTREVDLRRLYTFAPGPFTSGYETRRSALYGELGHDLSDRLHVSGSLRVERRDDRYRDSDAVAFDPEETLVGGRLVAEWTTAGGRLLFASVSRGYKAGGFNTDGTLDADLREYDAESVWNYEAGLKGRFLDDTLSARVAAFLMDRRDQQVSTSLVRVREDGSAEFIDFTGNAAEGRNYGLELEVDWAVGARLDLRGSLGLLATRLEDFVNSAGDDLSGRDQAHAPGWQFSLAGNYDLPGPFFARLETEGRDAFYWSDSHDARARGYVLAHARLGWRREGLEVAAWVRNLTDETFGVRGFGGFGNDPRDGYAVGEYVQFGQPRAWGLGTRIQF
jgi:outer membrane receptor protein involved in Fe transport